MLVLTRKSGERIRIGDNIVISVSEIRNDSVRIAIEAPKEIKILREELYEAIVKENKQASAYSEQKVKAIMEKLSGQSG